jgi:hypothetical protein
MIDAVEFALKCFVCKWIRTSLDVRRRGNPKSQRPAGLAGFILYFDDNKSDGVNLTFDGDLYLPLFEGDGVDL